MATKSAVVTGNRVVLEKLQFNKTVLAIFQQITISLSGCLCLTVHSLYVFSCCSPFSDFFPFLPTMASSFELSLLHTDSCNLRFLAPLWILDTLLLSYCFLPSANTIKFGLTHFFLSFWLTVCMLSAPIDSLGNSAYPMEKDK